MKMGFFHVLLAGSVLLGCGKDSDKKSTSQKKSVNDGAVTVTAPAELLAAADPSADFTFELDTSGVWKWNTAEEDSMEYSFFIGFSVGGKNYEVGYSNFSLNDAGSGTFEELINGQGHGQLDFWQEDEDGNWNVVDVGTIESVVTPNSLILKIGPNPIFAQLKAANITTAELKTDGEFMTESKKTVTIDYK